MGDPKDKPMAEGWYPCRATTTHGLQQPPFGFLFVTTKNGEEVALGDGLWETLAWWRQHVDVGPGPIPLEAAMRGELFTADEVEEYANDRVRYAEDMYSELPKICMDDDPGTPVDWKRRQEES